MAPVTGALKEWWPGTAISYDIPRGAKNLDCFKRQNLPIFKCWQLIYIFVKHSGGEIKYVPECHFWTKMTLNVHCVGECVWLLCVASSICHHSTTHPSSALALGPGRPAGVYCMKGSPALKDLRLPVKFGQQELRGETKWPAWPASGSAWISGSCWGGLSPLLPLPALPLGVSAALVGSHSPAHTSVNSPFIKRSCILPAFYPFEGTICFLLGR